MELNSLNHFKNITVSKLFVEPADYNYLYARLSAIHDFFEEYYWQGMQMIEKYLKAALLCNGGNASRQGHKLGELYTEYLSFFNNYAFVEFVRPDDIHDDYWHTETVESFIKKFENYGSPDSRYRITSWHYNTGDLFKLDQLCKNIRRHTIGLDWIIGQDWQDDRLCNHNGLTYGDLISANSDIQPRGNFSFANMPKVRPLSIDEILHIGNVSFPTIDVDIKLSAPRHLIPLIPRAKNSWLYLLYESLKKTNSTSSDSALLLREGTRWLLDNVKLSKDDQAAFEGVLRTTPST